MAKDVSAYTETIEITATDLLTDKEITFHIAPNAIRLIVLDGASISLLPSTDMYLSQGHVGSGYELRLVYSDCMPRTLEPYGQQGYSDYLYKMNLASRSHAKTAEKANKNRYDQSRFAFEVARYQRDASEELKPKYEFVLNHPQPRDLLKQLRMFGIPEKEV